MLPVNDVISTLSSISSFTFDETMETPKTSFCAYKSSSHCIIPATICPASLHLPISSLFLPVSSTIIGGFSLELEQSLSITI